MDEMNDGTEPDLSAPEGFRALPNLRPDGVRSFVTDEGRAERFRTRYYWRADEQLFLARVWFGPGTEGPPGCVHGGAMAAVLDDAMGATAWLTGHRVVGTSLATCFVRMIPLGTVCTVHTGVKSIAGEELTMNGRLTGPDGQVHCEGEAQFIFAKSSRFDAMWQRVQREANRGNPD